VDKVYLFGKSKFWEKGISYHYHYGLKAGENTLDALILRLLVSHLSAGKGALDAKKFRQEYVNLMTSKPCAFNDKYAGSVHRSFFVNYKNKVPLEECIGDNEHDQMDSLFNAIPALLVSLHSEKGECEKMAEEAIMSTKFSERGVKYAKRLREIFLALEKGATIKQVAQE
jgi:ADP-ribosyl-[dinitrogen reductase] hydrolase